MWRKTEKQGSSLGRAVRGENFLRFTGVALAVGSTAFAARMITDTNYQPQFAGIEHLSIFAKPVRTHTARLDEPDFSRRAAGVDYTPIGVVKGASHDHAKTGYVLLEGSSTDALLRTPRGETLHVTRGSALDTLGRVTAIERRAEHWVVVTSSGAVIE